MLSLIIHLGASVFRVTSHLLKESAHFGEQQKKKTVQVECHVWSEETFAISLLKMQESASNWIATKKKEREKMLLLGNLKREKSNWFAHHRKEINPATPGRKA